MRGINMKRHMWQVILGVVVSGAATVAAYAASASSPSYQLKETIAAAQGYAESASYKAYTSTGQPAPVAVSTSSSYIQQGGFIRLLDQGGWVLNLTGVPWRQNQLPHYKGAAVAEMILDYIRDGAGASNLSQSDIYNHIHPTPSTAEMNAAEMDLVLGHFDPYDAIVSNSSDTYDSQPGGNPYQGYNFTIDQHSSSDMTKYVRNICHWMAYMVKQWREGPFVARPNTPAALPFYGNYNWVTVKGFAADQNPTPDPNNPFVMPDFTVYGFWFKDPQVNGIGQDTYKTAAESIQEYFKPLATSDTYNGKLIQIAEPPPAQSQAQASIAETVSKKDVLSSSGFQLSADGSIQMMMPANNSITCEALVDAYAASDPEFREAVKDTRLGEVISVRRLVNASGVDTGQAYDLFPFGKRVQNGEYLTFAVVRLGSESAEFKEVSWVRNGQEYLKLSKAEAIQLAWQNMRSYPIESLEADTVWWPSTHSLTPFQPYWRITYNGTTLLYVTQGGNFIPKPGGKKLTDKFPALM